MKNWLPSLLTILLPTTGVLSAPTETPWIPIVKHKKSQEERIVLSAIPSHLMAVLLWEESNARRDAVRVEKNNSCSKGLLQRNGSCGERDAEADVDECIKIAEKFWVKSKNNWGRTKLAFRRGHL